jgi:hypothetical protein
VNDVTLKEGLKIANRKFHDLFQFCRGIHGKIITLPTNERIPAAEGLPNLFVRAISEKSPATHLKSPASPDNLISIPNDYTGRSRRVTSLVSGLSDYVVDRKNAQFVSGG